MLRTKRPLKPSLQKRDSKPIKQVLPESFIAIFFPAQSSPFMPIEGRQYSMASQPPARRPLHQIQKQTTADFLPHNSPPLSHQTDIRGFNSQTKPPTVLPISNTPSKQLFPQNRKPIITAPLSFTNNNCNSGQMEQADVSYALDDEDLFFANILPELDGIAAQGLASNSSPSHLYTTTNHLRKTEQRFPQNQLLETPLCKGTQTTGQFSTPKSCPKSDGINVASPRTLLQRYPHQGHPQSEQLIPKEAASLGIQGTQSQTAQHFQNSSVLTSSQTNAVLSLELPQAFSRKPSAPSHSVSQLQQIQAQAKNKDQEDQPLYIGSFKRTAAFNSSIGSLMNGM